MPPVPLTQVHLSEPGFRPEDTGQDRLSWTRFLVWFLFFFYFSGVHQAIIYASGIAGFFGLTQAMVMSLIWLVPVMLFPARGKLIAGITGFVLWTSSLFSMGYLALYHQDFSQSVIFIIFESNWAESSEFLHSYFAWWMLPALAVYTLIPWLIWRRLQPIGGTRVTRMLLIFTICLAVCWPMLDRVIIKKNSLAYGFHDQVNSMEPVAPWQLVMGYIKYRKALSNVENRLLASDKPPLEGLVDNNADTPNTLVLVIGESTNSRRLGIYGYYRDTTPRLSAMSDELLAFDQVYASRPYTVESLAQALSFADQLQPKLYLEKPTLVDVMKQAGYRTWWITNQQTQTQRNTLLTTFSKQADEQVYLNNNRSQNSAQYDEVVFRPFEDLLNRPESKKFILVHLIGTHRAYRYRYPESFKIFDDNEDLPPWVRKKRYRREYNEYDNAVRYNDFVVASLIEQMKKSGQNGYLVYFSDHGEEVYDYPHHLFAGRDEAAPTPAMYSVPFLVWQSESWKRKNRIDVSQDMTHRMYSLSDFFHTWMDLAGIRFSGFEPAKSIINQQYTYAPVLIGNPAKPETLVDVRRKFFPARATSAAPANPATTMQGPGPAELQPTMPVYGPEYGAVTGTVPVHVQKMLQP
jgi:heptose-I-phosphate ethanolaminephosphotransferase